MTMRLSCAEPVSHWYRKKSSECDAVDLKRSFVFGKKGTVDCITGSLDSSWGWDSYRIIGKQPDFSYFGEHACLLGEKRIATVVSISFCELHSLSRLSLEKMAHQWPELMDEILTLLDEYALRAVYCKQQVRGDWPCRVSSMLDMRPCRRHHAVLQLMFSCAQDGGTRAREHGT